MRERLQTLVVVEPRLALLTRSAYNVAMTWLVAALLIGGAAGWWAARLAPGPVPTALSVVVLASILGLLPWGRLGRRVLWRREG